MEKFTNNREIGQNTRLYKHKIKQKIKARTIKTRKEKEIK